MRLEIPFCGPTYETESPLISPQECINFYLRPYPELGKGKMALFGTPGLTEWIDLGVEGGVRGSIMFGDYLYVVAYDKMFRVDSSGTKTELGTLNTSNGLVGIDTNGIDVVVVDGPNGYVYDMATESFTQITDEDFPGGDSITQIDGYYLVNRPGTGQIYRSDWNDGSSWGGLAFSTAGGDPDNVIGLMADHRDVWIFGEYTTEVWFNTGEATFNFARIEGAFIEAGGTSHHAFTKANNAVYWLGKDKLGKGQVYQALGRVPKVISTTPINNAIAKYDLSDAYMFSYQQEGHTHVVLTIPEANETLVYDSSTGFWHKRSSVFNHINHRWRAMCHCFFADMNLVGDWNLGKLYKVDTSVYTDNGDPIISTRISPIISSDQKRITVDCVRMIVEPGVGLIDGDDQNTDPQAMFSWSRDGGRTWIAEVDLPLGKTGEFDGVSYVHQLGQGRNWAFRIRISAAVKRIILGAIAEVEADE